MEIKIIDSKVAGNVGRVISTHAKLAPAMKRAKGNVTGTFIIHERETPVTNERFLVCLPSL